MKKILLGTSALVVAALAATASVPAMAQTAPAPGFKSNNGFDVTLGGFSRQFVSYANSKNAAANVRDSGVDQTSDVRLVLRAAMAMPSGLTSGANIQINPLANTSTGNSLIRRQWAFLEGSFGQVQLGMTENVANQQAVTSLEAWFGTGFGGNFVTGDNNITNWTTTRAGSNPVQGSTVTTGGDTDGINSKIIYFTPRIEGFQLGVNYTPENSTRNNLPVAGVQYRDGWAASLGYLNTLGGVQIRAQAGYLTWDKPSQVNMTTAQALATAKTPKQFNAGLGFQYQGFDIGGSYLNLKDFRNIGGGTTTLAAALPVISSLKTINGYAWEAGVGYIFGPAMVSLNYSYSANDDSTFSNAGIETKQANGKDTQEIVGASLRYTLAPGTTANLGVFTAKFKDGQSVANRTSFNGVESVRSNVVATGLMLQF